MQDSPPMSADRRARRTSCRSIAVFKEYYEEVKAGTCWVNDPLTDNDAGPFGGMKFSGGARELGEEGWRNFWRPSMCIGISARKRRRGGFAMVGSR